MGRKTRMPSQNKRDRAIDPYETKSFRHGVIRDAPHSELPEDALADGYNVIVRPHGPEGRPGTVGYGSVDTPRIGGTALFRASLSDQIVTATSAVFTRAHVSNFVTFPGSPERHYEIVSYISTTRVRVNAAAAVSEPLTARCYLRGKLNLNDWHEMTKLWLHQWGRELYVRNLAMSSQTQMIVVSRDRPNNSIGQWATMDRYGGLLFNSGGMYHVELTEDPPIAYRVNVPVPHARIPEVARQSDSQYQYSIVYAAARLSGNSPLRSRLDPLRIETQTGPCAMDYETHRDYSEVWTTDPIGPGAERYAKLRGAPLDNGYESADAWAAISPDWGTFKINVNDIGEFEVAVDFTNVSTMPQVAAAIQVALQDFFPYATCTYVPATNGPYLEISTGRVGGATITYVTAGETGHSIAAELQMREGEGRISYPTIDTPKVLGPLWVPRVENTDPVEYQWHYTHFPIYRTLDLDNQYKQDRKAAAYNDPSRFVWEHDLRICAAFYVCVEDGIVTAMVGMFERADVGSTLEYDNGNRVEITGYIDAYRVRIGSEYYYGADGPCPAAAAIGNGRVFRASQTGNVVTRTHGATFTAADERKTLHWANGRRSIVREYLSPNQVRVYDSVPKSTQGATMDPRYRYYCSCTTDDTLRARMTTLLLPNRNWTAIPSCNTGVIAPGFTISARRGETDLEYGQLPEGYEYLAGYHNQGYQTNRTITDPVYMLLLTKQTFIALCNHRVWYGPTNTSEMITLPNSGEVVAVIGGVDILDPNIGCFDWGSVRQVGDQEWMMITNEPGARGLRKFNGFGFGPNLLVDTKSELRKFVRDVKALQQATTALYHGEVGYVLMGKE